MGESRRKALGPFSRHGKPMAKIAGKTMESTKEGGGLEKEMKKSQNAEGKGTTGKEATGKKMEILLCYNQRTRKVALAEVPGELFEVMHELTKGSIKELIRLLSGNDTVDEGGSFPLQSLLSSPSSTPRFDSLLPALHGFSSALAVLSLLFLLFGAGNTAWFFSWFLVVTAVSLFVDASNICCLGGRETLKASTLTLAAVRLAEMGFTEKDKRSSAMLSDDLCVLPNYSFVRGLDLLVKRGILRLEDCNSFSIDVGQKEMLRIVELGLVRGCKTVLTEAFAAEILADSSRHESNVFQGGVKEEAERYLAADWDVQVLSGGCATAVM